MHALGNLDLRDDLRMFGIFDVENRRAVGRVHMADIGVAILDDDLAAAGQVGAADEFYIVADAKLRQIAFAHGHAPCLVIEIFYQSQREAVKRKFTDTCDL